MEKKIVAIFCLIIGLCLNSCSCAFGVSENKAESEAVYYTCTVSKELASEAEQINNFLAEYFKAFKTRDINKLKELYANNFRNWDGFNKDDIIKIIQDGWDVSPDLAYSPEIRDVRFGENCAAIELYEKLTGETKQVSEITKDKGKIESVSKNIIYLTKLGNGWKIVADKTLYEQTSLKFGKAKDINIDIDVPEAVMPANDYTISLKTAVPENMFAIGSITKEKLVYPSQKQEEIFRQVPINMNVLERVVQAGNNNENELAIAAVGYCEVSKDSLNQPLINIAGTAVVIRRVNIMKNFSAANK